MEKEYDLVISLDVGTAYSGFAYSWTIKQELILTKDKWFKSNYIKTASVLLLKNDRERTLHSFGSEALFTYEHCDDKEQFLLFQNYKLALFDGKKREKEIKDSRSRVSVPIEEVFSKTIIYLKNAAIEFISNGSPKPILATKIYWVLTVPAIWDHAARQVMIEAAIKAGITTPEKKNFTLALEPEAASIYCAQSLASILKLTGGTKFMIIDAGGGTIDITCHEVLSSKGVKELLPPSGGDWGSVQINRNFQKMVNDILGHYVDLSKVKDRYDDLMARFEDLKVGINPRFTSYTIDVGGLLPPNLEEVTKKWNQQFPDTPLNSLGYLKLSLDVIMKKLFDPVLNPIKKEVDLLFAKKELNGLEYILVVGGFGESEVFLNFIKQNYQKSNRKVLCPPRPSSAVLSGAVQYGYNPRFIVSRVSPYSFGIETFENWKETVHNKAKKVIYAGKEYCENIFDTFIKVGEEIKGEKKVTKEFTAVHQLQNVVKLVVCRSKNSLTQYTTDNDVEPIGYLKLDIPDVGKQNEQRIIDITLKFGGVLVEIEAIYRKTKQTVKSELSFEIDLELMKEQRKKFPLFDAPPVDLCFVMDCTGSMAKWIDEAKDKIQSISEEVLKQYSKLKLRMAFVGYRDIGDESPSRFEIQDFTTDINEVQNFIAQLVATGGDDNPEDVLGGLEQCIALSWSSEARVLMHIADAPCHGTKYHKFAKDNYPQGDPDGLTPEVTLAKIKQKNITYNFIRIEESTDLMIEEFQKVNGPKIFVHKLNNSTSELTPTVVKSIIASVVRKN